MSARLEKVIVVGGSSGIGEAIAKRLADDGARVAVLGRREAELARVAAHPGGLVSAYAHDVRDFDAVPALFARVASDLGGVDALVYAAGVMTSVVEGEYAFDRDRTMVEVNLLGAMAWMSIAAARFEAAQRGTIVGISSIAGERGRRGNPGYCTSKAALSTYLESLRNRCSRYGVNVVTAKPGYVDTAMTRGLRRPFWMVSASEAARLTLELARRGRSASGFVPGRWASIALLLRLLPSFLFRRLSL